MSRDDAISIAKSYMAVLGFSYVDVAKEVLFAKSDLCHDSRCRGDMWAIVFSMALRPNEISSRATISINVDTETGNAFRETYGS